MPPRRARLVIGMLLVYIVYEKLFDLRIDGESKMEKSMPTEHGEEGPSEQSFDRFIEATCMQDRERISRVISIDIKSQSPADLKVAFFKAIMNPLQTSCKLIKRLGVGTFSASRYWEGQKNVCLDEILQPHHECIVYTFSFHPDESLIVHFRDLGCTVVAYRLGREYYASSDNKLKGYVPGKPFTLNITEEFRVTWLQPQI